MSSRGVRSIVGVSAWAESARAFVQDAADGRAPTLLVGPAGSGREHLARAIHAEGRRRDKPFVPVPCPTSDSPLQVGQIFGRVASGEKTQPSRGAALGCIRAADGGVVFFRDFDQYPQTIRDRVLEFLRTGQVTPLGAAAPQKVDVRVVLSLPGMEDSADKDATEARRAIANLLTTQGGALFQVVPLANRPEDLEPLVRHFWRQMESDESQASFQGATPAEMLTAIRRRQWSGDLAELRALVESLSAAESKSEKDLEAHITQLTQPAPSTPVRAADR